MIFARALGDALRSALETDERVILLGEDILDPYGGAFKVTRGLSSDFQERVRTTPISEAGIAGISAGLALAGFRPISEVMFGDFLTLCFDQIVNHIAKYELMYDGQATCPVIIRTPSGGGRAYGPTHSQSLEKHFLGVPNLKVVAASLRHDPHDAMAFFLGQESPVLYIEHKLLYPLHMQYEQTSVPVASEEGEDGFLKTVCVRHVPRAECVATVLAYGYQAELAWRVLDRLALEEEIFVELLVPASLSPIDWTPIAHSVAATGNLITVEEGTSGWSWGSEIAAEMSRRAFGELRRPVTIVASESNVIPGAPQREAEMLVGERHIEQAIRSAA
jgi:pyruvate/2-oxoglutarate/acetoin dehydrogenase E1 component